MPGLVPSIGRVTGQETQVVTLYHPMKQILFSGGPDFWGLGEICAKQACLLKANRCSRPNH